MTIRSVDYVVMLSVRSITQMFTCFDLVKGLGTYTVPMCAISAKKVLHNIILFIRDNCSF